jgi:hypothetical protein
MSAPESLSAERLAELLVSAASQLTAPGGSARGAFTPKGIPIRDGRLHLGRMRTNLDGHARVAVVAGFANAVWLGRPATAAPNLGRLAYRTETSVDGRGRLLLDFRVRSWLAVADTSAFEVVIVTADTDGLLVVPVEDFSHRWEVISQ